MGKPSEWGPPAVRRIEERDQLIFVDGRELTRGTFYGVFGYQLVARGPRDPDGFAEADVFDLRDGAHVRHLRLNLRRPLKLPAGLRHEDE